MSTRWHLSHGMIGRSPDCHFKTNIQKAGFENLHHCYDLLLKNMITQMLNWFLLIVNLFFSLLNKISATEKSFDWYCGKQDEVKILLGVIKDMNKPCSAWKTECKHSCRGTLRKMLPSAITFFNRCL